MGKNEKRTLFEMITEYSQLQKKDDDESTNRLTDLAQEIREELWIDGNIEQSCDDLKKEIKEEIRNHKHVDGKVVKDY